MAAPLILSNRLQRMFDSAKGFGDTVLNLKDRKTQAEDLARQRKAQDDQAKRDKELQVRQDVDYRHGQEAFGRSEQDRIAADEEQRQILGTTPTTLPSFGTAQEPNTQLQTGVQLNPMSQGGGLASPELSSMNPAPDVGNQAALSQGDQAHEDMLKAHLLASYRTHKTGTLVTPEEVQQEMQKAKLGVQADQAVVDHTTGEESRAQELQPFKVATEKADAKYKDAQAGAQGAGITVVPTTDGVKIFDKRGKEITNAGKAIPKPGAGQSRTQASLINDNKSERELYDKKAAAYITANGIKEAKTADGTPVWGSGTGDQNLIDQLIIMETGKAPTKAQYENTATKYGLGDYIDKISGKLSTDAKVSDKVRNLIWADMQSQAKQNATAYDTSLQFIANTAKANGYDSAQVVIPSGYRDMVHGILSKNTGSGAASNNDWDAIIQQASGKNK